MGSKRTWLYVGGGVGLALCLLVCAGAIGAYAFLTSVAKQVGTERRSQSPSVPPPDGQVVLNQTLDFANGEQTMQGASFLARTPSGLTVIVTAAHFLDFEGPALLRVTVRGATDSTTSNVAYGPPGNAGIMSEKHIDLTRDYLLLLPEAALLDATVLDMDTRPTPARGERVWVQNSHTAFLGPPFELLKATVEEATAGYVLIRFDRGKEEVELGGTSGSPVISQRTGKVIGLISRGGKMDGVTRAFLTPAAGIIDGMQEAYRTGARPKLSECVGKGGAK